MYRGVSDEEEPDWVKNEREQFENYRDKNKDGHMDAEEVHFDNTYRVVGIWFNCWNYSGEAVDYSSRFRPR